MKKLLFIVIFFSLTTQLIYAQGSGYSIQLNGEQDYIDCGNGLNTLALPISFTAWLYLDNGSNWNRVFASETVNSGTYYGFWVSVRPNDKLAISIGDGTGHSPVSRRSGSTDVNIPIKQWVHIAAVVRAYDDISLYVNGVSYPVNYSGTGATEIVHSNSEASAINIGRVISTIDGDGFQGQIDELSVWSKNLTTEEIHTYMCQNLSGNEDCLEAYWQLDTGTGEIVKDLSGNGHNGMFQGNTSWRISAAPIGNVSTFLYPDNWTNQRLTLSTNPNNDFTVSSIQNTPNGLHIYKVNSRPNTTNGIPNLINFNNIYYGVWLTNSTTQYTINYKANSFFDTCSLAKNNVLSYTRNDNAQPNWQSLATIYNLNNCLVIKEEESEIVDKHRAEYIFLPTSYPTEVTFTDSCRLIFPSAFSPNEDGINDRIKPYHECFFLTYELSIFNRWGNEVFKTNDSSKGWDGKYKFRLQPNGLYIWLIKYSLVSQNSSIISPQIRKGNFILLQ